MPTSRPSLFVHHHAVKLLAALLAGLALGALAPCRAADSPRERVLLDADWSFHLGDVASRDEAIAPSFDDRAWTHVQVPHDYVREGTYFQPNPPEVAGQNRPVRNHGYLPHGVGWYRRHLTIPESARGKILRLDFDGVYRESDVWLNGHLLGHHRSGYTPFSYDITAIAKPGADNVIAVRVDPREDEGWWYEGGGIYRHVNLTVLAPLHVAQWGTDVIATVPNGDQGADAEAELTIQTTLENSGAESARCTVVSEIVAPDGSVVATLKADENAIASGQRDVTQHATLTRPRLWSLQTPQLYQLRTTLLRDGKQLDAAITTFGIRTIRFDPDKGFFLNGQRVQIYGLACHQDFAGIGIAVPDSLQPWRVATLKKMGANGWRTAHNPPSESLLDACDRMGMLVMDENRHLGDTYAAKTVTGTTADDLSDLATMIRRDRHHPSIIMWSLCNEEPLQGKPEGAAIFSKMMDVVHRYDRTRPITSAMHAGWLTDGIADVEDIIGVNYNPDKYDAIHRRHPTKTLFGSECMNQKTARGEYADNPAAGMSSAYNLSDKTWQAVADRPFMAGSYTWTGFDYKGEPNPYGWPTVSNNTGFVDLCGFPKDRYYYFESCWSTQPMVHVLPIVWNHTPADGKPVRVIAFSNAREVELFLNGRSLGKKDHAPNHYVEWSVPFEPGQLLARGYIDGKLVATDQVETTSAPERLDLTPDRTTLHADGDDTVVVPVSILDEKGRLVTDSSNRVTFQLTGGGRILGVGNGNAADHDPDAASERNAFHGHCIVVIQGGSKSATLQLTATSPGLASKQIKIVVQ